MVEQVGRKTLCLELKIVAIKQPVEGPVDLIEALFSEVL